MSAPDDRRLCIAAGVEAAPITPGSPLPVRILYDNSGSMYPGYRPPGSPDRHTRDQLGVHFFYQAPGFAQWLDDFVRGQAAMGGATAGMWTFTSNGAFTPATSMKFIPLYRCAISARKLPWRTSRRIRATTRI